MRHLSLFTGAGGGELGAILCGWTTVGYVEYDDYCQRVLKARINDGLISNAPIYGDIRTFLSDRYADAYTGMVDVIAAGFPCQPFSIAGKQLGESDPRNMWPETARCISIVRPRFALLENVPALLTSGYFGTVLGDLAEMGYDARWGIISAASVGALHKRDRLWTMAYTHDFGWYTSRDGGLHKSQSRALDVWPKKYSTNRETDLRLLREWIERQLISVGARTDDDVANRVDRLRAIGNGQVPAVAATAWEILSGGAE